MKFCDPYLVVNGQENPSQEAVLADIEASIDLLLGVIGTLRGVREEIKAGTVTQLDYVLSFASVAANGWDQVGPSRVNIIPEN